MNTTTNTRGLSETERQPGAGVHPEDLPEAARMMSVDRLRALGLPFSCKGGEIVEDSAVSVYEDGDDDDREPRVVLFKLGDECMSVEYTRPIDCAITQKFEPWPNETKVLVTLHDEDDDGTWHQREVGEESPAQH